MLKLDDKIALAYVTGVALGDGNLSRVSRAVRLRISCDLKYPNLINEIRDALAIIAPNNKINVIKVVGNCVDICTYSNDWEKALGWKVGNKITQQATVPTWIFQRKKYIIVCLKGLLQTDGSIYIDRGYKMVNFVNHNRKLAVDVLAMVNSLGFRASFTEVSFKDKNTRYTVRIARDCEKFINYIGLTKD
jgi:DNA-binding transcriptional regulator WhiA